MLDREKALSDAMGQIEKQFGKGAVMRLGSNEIPKIAALSTGALTLDLALGIGGIPRGRIIEIYGPDASGKTTLALHLIAETQKGGEVAAFIDAEHAMDPNYAKTLGVNTDDLIISQPDYGEQALQIAETLINSGVVGIIVIDSVAALVPRAEVEGDMGDAHVGLQARLMSQAMRKLAGAVYRNGTTVVFINQLREKVGVIYGSPEVTPGGRALKFYASVRIDLRKGETIKEGTEPIGNRVKAKIVKNKVAPPFKEAEFDLMYGTGISWESSLLDVAVVKEIVRKSGAWYTYQDLQLGQGKERAKAFLTENPALAAEIEQKIRGTLVPAEEEEEDGR